MNIKDYGYDGELTPNKDNIMPARVIATYRDRYEIVCNKGKTFATLKKGSFYDNIDAIYPTVGDFVLIKWNDNGESKIIETLKRKSFFSRVDPSPGMKHEQPISANFDYIFIIQSLNENYNIRRIERYLALSWQSGATPVIILTKSDLVDNYLDFVFELENIAIGVDVYAISCKTGEGLKAIEKYFKPGKTIVFLGSSGVGKSTLVNTLIGKEVMKTSEIREDDSRGRHTTTFRQLIMLPSKTMIIDTPGMRELGMWNAIEGIDITFKDIEKYIQNCKFSNCTHTNEPGCKVLEAIKNGEISKERFDSYIKLKNEENYCNDSKSYIMKKKKKFKEISKLNKNNTRK